MLYNTTLTFPTDEPLSSFNSSQLTPQTVNVGFLWWLQLSSPWLSLQRTSCPCVCTPFLTLNRRDWETSRLRTLTFWRNQNGKLFQDPIGLALWEKKRFSFFLVCLKGSLKLSAASDSYIWTGVFRSRRVAITVLWLLRLADVMRICYRWQSEALRLMLLRLFF